MLFTSKDAQCYDQSYCNLEIFLRFFIFELLSIFYFIVVNSDLGQRPATWDFSVKQRHFGREAAQRGFAKYAVDAILFRLGS